MHVEIITAVIAAATTLITCLVKTSFDKKKMLLDFEQRDQEKIQTLLDSLSEKEDKRASELIKWQTECTSKLNELQHSIDKTNIQLQNVEERLSDRIDSLAKHVDKHNNFAERMPVVEEQIKSINHRIEDLEKR